MYAVIDTADFMDITGYKNQKSFVVPTLIKKQLIYIVKFLVVFIFIIYIHTYIYIEWK